MTETIYLAFAAKLTSITGIKHVDEYEDQIDNDEINDPFNCPAVFIEFETVDWKDSGKGVQTGILRTNFYIAQKTVSNAKQGSRTQDKAVEKYRLPQTIHHAIQNFDGETFTGLTRVRTVKMRSVGMTKIFMVTYVCTVTDNDGSQAVPIATGVTLDIEKSEIPTPSPDTSGGYFMNITG